MTIFNVGDRVQAVDGPYGPVGVPVGTAGTVTEIRMGGALCLVAFDNTEPPFEGSKGWAVYPHELIEEAS